MKGLAALKEYHNIKYGLKGEHTEYECYKTIEKELKALKILLNADCISVVELENGNYFIKRNVDNFLIFQITKEEYDLLKEVINNARRR